MSTIDLDKPPPNHKYAVSIEREETSGERAVRLGKDVTLFALAVVFVVLVVWICYSALASATSSAEEKKWAQSALSAAAAGLIGYLVRK